MNKKIFYTLCLIKLAFASGEIIAQVKADVRNMFDENGTLKAISKWNGQTLLKHLSFSKRGSKNLEYTFSNEDNNGTVYVFDSDSNTLSSFGFVRGEKDENVTSKDKQTSVLNTKEDSYKLHYVRNGETLWSIARKNDISLTTILDANPEYETIRLNIGTPVRVPKKVAPSLSQNFDKQKLKSEMLDLKSTIQKLNRKLDPNLNSTLIGIVRAQIQKKEDRLSEVTRILDRTFPTRKSGINDKYGFYLLPDSSEYSHIGNSFLLHGKIVLKDIFNGGTYAGIFDNGRAFGIHVIEFPNGDNIRYEFKKDKEILVKATFKEGKYSTSIEGCIFADNYDQENSIGQSDLGLKYENGKDVTKDSSNFVGELKIVHKDGYDIHLINEDPNRIISYDINDKKVFDYCYGGIDYGHVGKLAYYSPSGSEICLMKKNSGNRLSELCRISYANGKIAMSVNYENGFRSGLTKLYFQSGIKAAEINYDLDRITGNISAWYENGVKYNPQRGFLSSKVKIFKTKQNLWMEGQLKRGKPSGIHNIYLSDGTIEKSYSYESQDEKSDTIHKFGIFNVAHIRKNQKIYPLDKKSFSPMYGSQFNDKPNKARFHAGINFAGFPMLSEDKISAVAEEAIFKILSRIDSLNPIDKLISQLGESGINCKAASIQFGNQFVNVSQEFISKMGMGLNMRLGLSIKNSYAKGVEIISINPNLPISQSGMVIGDLIIGVNEVKIENSLEFIDQLCKVQPLGKTKFTVSRDNGNNDYEVESSERLD